ncbi:MAG: hypothetical protein FWG16_03020 [Micrococcales bacterium]|nr:hypothetical protein [Micrococcales bacterium]
MEQPKERIPMWLAVGITVVVGLPFGLWLAKWGSGPGLGLALFVSFTVWAQYFAFGASPKGIKLIVPAYLGGAVWATLVHMFSVLLQNLTNHANLVAPEYFGGDVGLFIGYFLGFCAVIYSMKYVPLFQKATLAYFQGISLTLGCIFTGYGVAWVGGSGNEYVLVIGGLIASAFAMALGCFLGWFNVMLMHGPNPKPSFPPPPLPVD